MRATLAFTELMLKCSFRMLSVNKMSVSVQWLKYLKFLLVFQYVVIETFLNSIEKVHFPFLDTRVASCHVQPIHSQTLMKNIDKSARPYFLFAPLRNTLRMLWWSYPVNFYLLKVNNKNIRKRYEICSKLTKRH